MISSILALVTLILLGISPAMAQESPTEITRGQLEPVPAPILQGDMMSNAAASAIFKQCRSFFPRRFTPSALDSYCDCAMTATQVSLTAKEYADLQNKRNQKVTNPLYQKYITQVVAPCMGKPTVDIEYMECALDRFSDTRVSHLPKYCQCVAKDMQSHVNVYGDVDILITMSTNPQVFDPYEALWMSPKYLQTKRDAKMSCLGNNIKRPVQYSYN